MNIFAALIGVLFSLVFSLNAFAQSVVHTTETRSGNWINLTDVNAGQSHLRFGKGEGQQWFRLSCWHGVSYDTLILRVQPFRNYTGVDQHEINVQILVDDHPYQLTSYHTEWPNHRGVSDYKFMTAKFRIQKDSDLLKRMYFSKQIQFGIPGLGAPYSLIEMGEQGAALNEFQNASSRHQNACLEIQGAGTNEPKVTASEPAQPQNTPSQEPTPGAEFEYVYKKHENSGHDAVMQVLDNQSRTQWMAFWCHPETGSTIHFNVLDKKGIAPNGDVDLVIDVDGKQVSIKGNKRGELIYFSSDLYSELKKTLFSSDDLNASTSIYFNGQSLIEPQVNGVPHFLYALVLTCLQERPEELEQFQTYLKNLAEGVETSTNSPANAGTQPTQDPVANQNTAPQAQPVPASDPNTNIPTDPNALAQLCSVAFPKPGSDLAKACELVTGLISGQIRNQPQQQSFSQTYNYLCANGAGFAVRYDDNGQASSALLIMQGIPEIQLPQVVSASGNKYNNGQIDWHTKGTNGILTQGSQTLSCSQQ